MIEVEVIPPIGVADGVVKGDVQFAQLDLVYGRVERAHERLAVALDFAQQLVPASPEAAAWCHVQLGELAYQGLWWDPFKDDLEAFIGNTQKRVSGAVTMRLYKGSLYRTPALILRCCLLQS